MLTFFDFISTIHGCSIIFQGLALRLGSFSRLRRVSVGSWSKVVQEKHTSIR